MTAFPTHLLDHLWGERTPADLLEWIDRARAEVEPLERSSSLSKSQKDFAKKLREEARPLALFGILLAERNPGLTVQPITPGPSRPDAILRSPGWTAEQPLEISLAIDGYQEHLRDLHLWQLSHAPAIGSIEYERKGGRPHIRETELVARKSTDICAAVHDQIHAAALRKLKKPYPQNYWLLIVFDDNVAFWKGDRPNVQAISELNEFFDAAILSLPWCLTAVYAVGSSGRTVVGRPLV